MRASRRDRAAPNWRRPRSRRSRRRTGAARRSAAGRAGPSTRGDALAQERGRSDRRRRGDSRSSSMSRITPFGPDDQAGRRARACPSRGSAPAATRSRSFSPRSSLADIGLDDADAGMRSATVRRRAQSHGWSSCATEQPAAAAAAGQRQRRRERRAAAPPASRDRQPGQRIGADPGRQRARSAAPAPRSRRADPRRSR